MNKLYLPFFTLLILSSCLGKQQNLNNNKTSDNMITDSINQYSYNLEFLKKHTTIIELKRGNSRLAVAPAWQARVMTSTSEGDQGFSFGWINHQLIASHNALAHINPFGGEERIWLGPEGGQFSIFFKKGDDFIYDNWQTPAFLDTIAFTARELTDSTASFSHIAEVINYSGTVLNLSIERMITLLDITQLNQETGIDFEGINFVGYRSENILTNIGSKEWKKETGLLSIWMLGMFNPSPAVTVIIPVKKGDEMDLGPVVNDNYFGKISEERLKILGENVYFKADGKSRGKIGISPLRSTGTMGSYDFRNNILTLLLCKIPESNTEYVNSAWEIQEDPYSGDALNSYNDGPLEDGSQMGPFYELETSSSAAALEAGKSITHSQITIHMTGPKDLLNKAALKVFGVTLNEIEKIFN
jgi:hypothetical protein